MKVRKGDVWSVVKNAFPGYAGRKFRIEATEKVSIDGTNWCEGTRNKYAAVVLGTGDSRLFDAPAPWVNTVEGTVTKLVPGMVIVVHSIFQGHDLGITIYVHPENMPKFIGLDAVKENI